MIPTIFSWKASRKEFIADFLHLIATEGDKSDKGMHTFHDLSQQFFPRPGPVKRLRLQPAHSGTSHIGHQRSVTRPDRIIPPDQGRQNIRVHYKPINH